MADASIALLDAVCRWKVRWRVAPDTFLEMMNKQSKLFQDWTNAVIQMAENLPSADVKTRDAWRRQAETAVAALKAHEQMMTQITRTIAATVAADKSAMESSFETAAPIMDEFMRTWGPHLRARQDLVENWSRRKSNTKTNTGELH